MPPERPGAAQSPQATGRCPQTDSAWRAFSRAPSGTWRRWARCCPAPGAADRPRACRRERRSALPEGRAGRRRSGRRRSAQRPKGRAQAQGTRRGLQRRGQARPWAWEGCETAWGCFESWRLGPACGARSGGGGGRLVLNGKIGKGLKKARGVRAGKRRFDERAPTEGSCALYQRSKKRGEENRAGRCAAILLVRRLISREKILLFHLH